MNARIAVVGAGWSGLACALELARNGCSVTLIDAAPRPGGRARGVEVEIGDRRFRLDNGQHLLIGAYRDTLRLMRTVGVDVESALLRLPFELRYPDGFLLRGRRLPPPLHLAAGLLGASGLNWHARWRALRWVRGWRSRGWRLAHDAPATRLFDDTPDILLRRLWRPLCLAALNVELDQASAQVLLNVLRDSLASDARAADLLIPRSDLSGVFAEPALAELHRHGVAVHLRNPVQRIARQQQADGWRVECRDDVHTARAIVLALPPQRAAALLSTASESALRPAIDRLQSIACAPIATVYLRYAASLRLPRPVFALLDDASARRYGQWVFDRGQLDPANAGVLSVVISAADAAVQIDGAQLTAAVARQLSDDLGLPAPMAGTVIAEKRATIVPAPNLVRPPARLPQAGLYLAGDAAASDFPSTLEGSVRAGLAAAAALIADARSDP